MEYMWYICGEFDTPVPLTDFSNPFLMPEISHVFVFHTFLSRHAIAANQFLHKRTKMQVLGMSTMKKC